MFLLTASAASGRYADTGPITTMHLLLIAVLIVLVVCAIVWGARQKRARAEGERIEAERTEALLAHPPTEAAVAPPPPPLGDAGVTATAPVAKPRAAAKPKPAAKAPAAAPPKAAASKPAPAAKAPAKAAAPKPAAAQPAKVATAKAAAATGSTYGLIDVKGLGPKAIPLLAGLGITTLAELAALDPGRAAEVDGQLGVLSGRLTRDRWVDQARLLNAGDVAAFEAAYGKL